MHYVYIPGMDRCGTSWVTRWLKKHPDIYVENERYLIPNLSRVFLRKGIAKAADVDVQNMRRIVLEESARWNAAGKAYFIDKSPGTLLTKRGGESLLAIVAELLPQARVLVFYKYGPDYVFSRAHLPAWGRSVMPAESVTTYVENIRLVVPDAPPANTLFLKYEDLCARPDEMAARIGQFLGIALEHKLEPWTRPVNTRHVRYDSERWKTMSLDEIEDMTRMDPELVRLGYPSVASYLESIRSR